MKVMGVGRGRPAEIPGKNAHSRNSAAPGAADDTQNAHIDPDLPRVIDAWPALPEAVKAGILAMVEAD